MQKRIKMSYKKIAKSANALSPVVASIILIAVTVAVSIAVAVWMGGLTSGFMQTEQVTITNISFNYDSNTVTITVTNAGTSGLTINEFWINNIKQTYTPQPIQANQAASASVTSTLPVTAGSSYQIKIVTAKGNQFLTESIAP
jgi:flagellin-like protein